MKVKTHNRGKSALKQSNNHGLRQVDLTNLLAADPSKYEKNGLTEAIHKLIMPEKPNTVVIVFCKRKENTTAVSDKIDHDRLDVYAEYNRQSLGGLQELSTDDDYFYRVEYLS
ncbi:hypothetical protein CWI38_0195p0010 [Hamiltosporidium tvaerminnensis]|uniref:Uncharacterized protein n=1 Tax=Hamiltosporidium tvaerminnensis TaxID=1176355 RepID=A0A4Q9LZU9_9MICR|nr:hypothetical protein CWI38_0195p0010 [Hamiltosporidium tvaerminnensis]